MVWGCKEAREEDSDSIQRMDYTSEKGDDGKLPGTLRAVLRWCAYGLLALAFFLMNCRVNMVS